MNLSLLDPFQGDLPEVIEEYLDNGVSRCIAFNRRGTLLAAGCMDGSCVIWDFDTRGVAKIIPPSHSPLDPSTASHSSVTAVAWSKCGHFLVTASTASTPPPPSSHSSSSPSLTLWSLPSGHPLHTFPLPSPALQVSPNPLNPKICVASPLSSPALLLDLQSGVSVALPTSSTPSAPSPAAPASSSSSAPVAVAWSKRGEVIFVATVEGEVLVVSPDGRRILSVVKVPGGALVRQLRVSRDGRFVVTNSSDRTLRVFEAKKKEKEKDGGALNGLKKERDSSEPVEDPEAKKDEREEAQSVEKAAAEANANEEEGENSPLDLRFAKEYLDAVNRVQWKTCGFSGNGEYVFGAAMVRGEHKIHVWSREFGQLVRILEGPKEAVVDLMWHPTRPLAASVSQTGVVYLWAKDYVENWSAFAPDFKELEENEEYVEREDEFDVVLGNEEEKARPQTSADENVEVDIETVERIAAFSDSDDSETGLHYLPVAPEPEEEEEGEDEEERGELEEEVKEGQLKAVLNNSTVAKELNAFHEKKSLTSFDSQDDKDKDYDQREDGLPSKMGRKRRLSEKGAELKSGRVTGSLKGKGKRNIYKKKKRMSEFIDET